MLFGKIFYGAVVAILVMKIVAVIYVRLLVTGRQLVHTNQLGSLCVNTFAVYRIGTAKFFVPLHLSSPTVFVNVARGYRCYAVVLSVERPLIKNRQAVLQRYIGKVIVVYIPPELEVVIVNTQQGLRAF